MKQVLGMVAAVAMLSGVVSISGAAEITILRDDFDAAYLSPTDWNISITPGSANVSVNVTDSELVLETVPNDGVGRAFAWSTKRFSLADGPLIFRSRVNDAYVDHQIYGNAQPRGLVSGADRKNAIEFTNAYPVPNTVACRTVSDGVVTSTKVNINQSVRAPNVYQIIATTSSVEFYVNGRLVATHTTNIPTVPLNVYFSTGDSGYGNVPVEVDYVSFERIR